MPTSEETVLSRIRDAAESGATHLDLSRSVLETLPPEIGELAALLPADRGGNVTASGNRSVAIGGDARGNVIITGDNNKV